MSPRRLLQSKCDQQGRLQPTDALFDEAAEHERGGVAVKVVGLAARRHLHVTQWTSVLRAPLHSSSKRQRRARAGQRACPAVVHVAAGFWRCQP